jgi:hypothetical protein
MMQATLDEYLDDGLRCRYCGRKFSSKRALNIHLSRRHMMEAISKGWPFIYADEGVEVERGRRLSIIKIRIRSSGLQTLEMAAKRMNMTLEELLFKAIEIAWDLDVWTDPSYPEPYKMEPMRPSKPNDKLGYIG